MAEAHLLLIITYKVFLLSLSTAKTENFEYFQQSIFFFTVHKEDYLLLVIAASGRSVPS